MPLPNVVWYDGFVLFFCACMHPRVHPETLLTRCLAEYLIHFHQIYISDGSEMNASQFWWIKVCWKQHFLAVIPMHFCRFLLTISDQLIGNFWKLTIKIV